MYGHDLLNSIEKRLKSRFEIGRPFSTVERMVAGLSICFHISYIQFLHLSYLGYIFSRKL